MMKIRIKIALGQTRVHTEKGQGRGNNTERTSIVMRAKVMTETSYMKIKLRQTHISS